MAAKKIYSDFPASISCIDLLRLLFGKEVTRFVVNPSHCPGKLRQKFNTMRAFVERLERAYNIGELIIVVPGTSFLHHSWVRDGVFQWLHTSGNLKWLEDKGVEIFDDVKRTVEKALLANIPAKEHTKSKKNGGQTPSQQKEVLGNDKDQKLEEELEELYDSNKQGICLMFPESKILKWSDVRIGITVEGHVAFGFEGKRKKYNLEDIKAIFSHQHLNILYHLIHNAGVIDSGTIDGIKKENFKQAISRFRTKLCSVFGLEDDPLPFENGEYRAKFPTYSNLA